MKAILNISTVFVAVILLSICSCGDSPEKSCKDDDFTTRYSVGFNLSVKVVNNDGTAYVGPVTYSINKEYCDGEAKGHYTKTGTTSATGYWNPNYIMTYDYTNPEDIVRVEWSVPNKSIIYYVYDVDDTKGKTMITQTFDYELD